MLTYQAPLDVPINPAKGQDKPWLLLLLCCFWLVPGLVGHDPWKPDENVSMAITSYFMHNSNWTIASIAGVPQLSQAPLYFWVATLFVNALSWIGVAPHDAARLSTGLWMALGLWGVGLAGRELFGRRSGRLSVVILLGCLGLPLWAHHISPAVVLLTGFAWYVYALGLAIKKPLRAGIILAGVFIVLLTGVSWADALFAVLFAVFLFVFPQWRKFSYLITLITAILISIPIAALWGYSLKTHSSEVFQVWWRYYAWGAFGGARSFAIGYSFGFLPAVLLWFSWPALPLAAWSVYLFRKELSQPRWQLLLSVLLAKALFVMLAIHQSEALVLPLLVPLTLLATGGVDELRRGAAASFNWFSLVTLGFAAFLVWFVWMSLVAEKPLALVNYFTRFNDANMPWPTWGFIFALLVTAIWGRVLFRKQPLGRRALTNWTSGLTLVIGLLVGLFQSWIDAGKSYRPVAESLSAFMQGQEGQCIDVSAIAKDPTAALVYFTELQLDAKSGNHCPLYIKQTAEKPTATPAVLWSGHRLGDQKENFTLHAR
nr:glycosyltransferase family 39 protein [uncultured Deefgea sp.]